MHFSRTPPWHEKCAGCKRGSALTSCGAAILSTVAPTPNQTAVAHYCARPDPTGATISIVEDMGRGNADSTAGTVFVFPSQGSQWAEKAVELLHSAPAFAEQMRLCDAALAEFVDWSLLAVVRGSVGSPSLDRVDVVQPVLFAAMVSLAAHWRALGIEPDAVLGHSHGEIAAAYVAGGVSLRDAAKVVTVRSKAIGAIAGAGGMVSFAWPIERVHALIEPWRRSISVAAQNGPSSAVVTGNGTALDDLMALCERDGVPATRLPGD